MDSGKSAETLEALKGPPPNGAEAGTVPPPTPKSAGRPKGSMNKITAIAKEAICDAAPHDFLIKVMEGRQFKRAGSEGGQRQVKVYPTLEQSLDAARILLRKIAPDLKAVELSGDPDSPLNVSAQVYEQVKDNPAELARRSVILLEALGIRKQVERALDCEEEAPAQNGYASLLQPGEMVDVTPSANEFVEMAAKETPSARGIRDGTEIRTRSLLPDPGWVLHLGPGLEGGNYTVQNHGPIRPNLPDPVYSLKQGSRQLLQPQSWTMVEKKLNSIMDRELPYSLIPARPVSDPDPSSDRGWLGKFRK